MPPRRLSDTLKDDFATGVARATSWADVQALLWGWPGSLQAAREIVLRESPVLDEQFLLTFLLERADYWKLLKAPALTPALWAPIERWALARAQGALNQDDVGYATELLGAGLEAGLVQDTAAIVSALLPLAAPSRVNKSPSPRQRHLVGLLLAVPNLPSEARLRLARQCGAEGELVRASVERSDAEAADWLVHAVGPEGGWGAWPSLNPRQQQEVRTRLRPLINHPPARQHPAVRAVLRQWLATTEEAELVIKLLEDCLPEDARLLYGMLQEFSEHQAANALLAAGDALGPYLTRSDLLPHLESTTQPVRLAALTASSAAQDRQPAETDVATLPIDERTVVAEAATACLASATYMNTRRIGDVASKRSIAGFMSGTQVLEHLAREMMSCRTVAAAMSVVDRLEQALVAARADHPFGRFLAEGRIHVGSARLRGRLVALESRLRDPRTHDARPPKRSRVN